MFLFLIISGAILAGGAASLISDIVQKGQISDRLALKGNKKAFKPTISSQIIGLQNPVLVKSPAALTTTKFDTTTYNDRAVVTLTNSTGSDSTTNGWAIRGEPVMQYSGEAGYTWEYSDYADIEINGENSYEISNRFITSGALCEYIGDWSWKELRPHDMYSLSIPGALHFYELGDVWHLSATNLVSGASSENELIDVDVAIEGVSIRKTVGEPGETLLDVRVPSGTWNKTTSMRARRIASGNPDGQNNRGNVLTVASSTWTGQADYYCTGTDDQITILQAINSLDAAGGGELVLTPGIFDISGESGIYLNGIENILMHGSGAGTILSHSDTTTNKTTILLNNSRFIYIRDLLIDGNSIRHSGASYGIRWTNSCDTLNMKNVAVTKIYASTSAGGAAVGINGAGYPDYVILADVESCNITDVNGRVAAGLGHCDRTYGNYIDNIIGIDEGYGIFYCLRSGRNQVGTVSGTVAEKYSLAYADGMATNVCADTANGGYNS